MENLDRITETMGGYLVKNLRYKKVDNLIVGMVLDPIWGRDSLHNGFVNICWNKRGKVDKRYGGSSRQDLELDIKKTL
jgi:hypothetical protein